jgi:hypothetical protein
MTVNEFNNYSANSEVRSAIKVAEGEHKSEKHSENPSRLK